MKRKSIVLVLVALLAVALPASATLAQGDPVAVCHPFPGQPPCTAEAGDEVVIYWGWLACSKGLVKNFLKAIDEHAYTVTGPKGFYFHLGTEATQQLWGPIQEAPTHPACMGNMKSGAVSFWQGSVGTLDEPGVYTLHTVLSLKHPVRDGMDADGDGLPNSYSAFDVTKPITVTVTAPNG